MFSVETNVDPELQMKIALREKFEPARAKQAILMVATWQLINDLANAWSVRKPGLARRGGRAGARPGQVIEIFPRGAESGRLRP
jgi:hypothetical protein